MVAHRDLLDYRTTDAKTLEHARRGTAVGAALGELHNFITLRFAEEADHDPLINFLFQAYYPDQLDDRAPATLPPGVGGAGQVLHGWRRFDVGPNIYRPLDYAPWLLGQTGRVWYGQGMEAQCFSEDYPCYGESAAQHLRTGECTCGLYAKWEYDQLHAGLLAFSVVASVVGWGATVLHEGGYRSEEMEIERLWIIDQMTPRQRAEMFTDRAQPSCSMELANILSDRYGVPCLVGAPDNREPPAHQAALTIANEARCGCGSVDVGTASILFAGQPWVIGCSCGKCGKGWAKEAADMGFLLDGPPVRPVRSLTHWGDGFRLE